MNRAAGRRILAARQSGQPATSSDGGRRHRRSRGKKVVRLTLSLALLTVLALMFAVLPNASTAGASAPNTWMPAGNLNQARHGQTATLLPNGQVLVAGGSYASGGGSTFLASAELYDPATGAWTPTGSMSTPRYNHTATLLPNGQVLVTGGYNSVGTLASAELYDPNTGIWTAAGSMTTPRQSQTATLLPSGQVLIAGGVQDPAIALASAELYDPSTGIFTATGSMAAARRWHSATLLPNGQVLVTGGEDSAGSILSSAELYDPNSATWSPAGSMSEPRRYHTATLLSNGQVLVAGGYNDTTGQLDSAELYDPGSGTWTATGSMTDARQQFTAALLPNGQVLVAGGDSTSGSVIASAELYDPATGTWVGIGHMAAARNDQTATVLPNGQILIVGGVICLITCESLSGAELYTPPVSLISPTSTAFRRTIAATGSMSDARNGQTATLLPNGQVLVAGGSNEAPGGTFLSSAELYDPSTGAWTPTGSMTTPRYDHRAALLPNGQVLVTGGYNSAGALASAEIYDPSTGVWTSTGSMAEARQNHSMTLLPTGQVLVAGGMQDQGNALASAELYDPSTGTFTATGSMVQARGWHTATLLSNGKVLVAGGGDSADSILASAEVYDPSTGAWTSAGSMSEPRRYHTATLLANGQVLVAGGYDDAAGQLDSAELYNPSTGLWTPTGSMTDARQQFTAALLATGQVLVTGGDSTSGSVIAGAELYNPDTGRWTRAGHIAAPRSDQTETLLPSGQMLIAGGENCNLGCTSLTSAELYLPLTLGITTGANSNAMSDSAAVAHTNIAMAASTTPSVSSVVYKQTITVTGTDFSPNETVKLYWDSPTSAPLAVTTASGGSFSAAVSIPQAPHGRHAIIAVGQSSFTHAFVYVRVRPRISMLASVALGGSHDVLRGYGFAAGEPVKAYWAKPISTFMGSALTRASGTFDGSSALTVTVPLSPTGIYALYAVGQRSGAIAVTFIKIVHA